MYLTFHNLLLQKHKCSPPLLVTLLPGNELSDGIQKATRWILLLHRRGKEENYCYWPGSNLQPCSQTPREIFCCAVPHLTFYTDKGGRNIAEFVKVDEGYHPWPWTMIISDAYCHLERKNWLRGVNVAIARTHCAIIDMYCAQHSGC